jgi:hypothetical protein
VSRGARVTALAAALVALSLGVAAGVGCGDDGDDDTVSIPTISVEETTTEATTTEQTTTAPPTTTEGGGGNSGGTPSYDPNQEDGPANDKPPDPGSPEEAFENFCKENPGACG